MCRNHHRLDSIKNALSIHTQISLCHIVFCTLWKDTYGPCMYNCVYTNTQFIYSSRRRVWSENTGTDTKPIKEASVFFMDVDLELFDIRTSLVTRPRSVYPKPGASTPCACLLWSFCPHHSLEIPKGNSPSSSDSPIASSTNLYWSSGTSEVDAWTYSVYGG